MNGLAPHTLRIFEAVASLDCIKPYLLVGGTALSLQINTRQSEDLDFKNKKYFSLSYFDFINFCGYNVVSSV